VSTSTEYLSNTEAAALLGVVTRTLDNWRRKRPGFPRPIRLPSGRWRWRRAELLAWIESHAAEGTACAS
jgi:predicted DNA-binding transcriptional regulator AlpA